MPKRKNKLDRQKNSRKKLADSIFRTMTDISSLETRIQGRTPLCDYDKLMGMHYKLSQNLKEYIQVNDKIIEEEVKLLGIFKTLTQ